MPDPDVEHDDASDVDDWGISEEGVSDAGDAAGGAVSETQLGDAARALSKEDVYAALRDGDGTLWGAAKDIHAAAFFKPFHRLGVPNAADGPTFVRKRTLPRCAQARWRGADLPLDTARAFAAVVQDERHALFFLDTATPIDVFQIGTAKRLEGNGYACYTVLVPHSDSAPAESRCRLAL
jgi:hypothetical protein